MSPQLIATGPIAPRRISWPARHPTPLSPIPSPGSKQLAPGPGRAHARSEAHLTRLVVAPFVFAVFEMR
jgi:hypothetical protein